MSNYLGNNFDMSDPDLVSSFDELPLWSAPFGLTLLESVKPRNGMKALDIGCGTGFLAIELAQRLGSDSKVYALDPWRAALDRFRLKLKATGVGNVEPIEASAEFMPFRDGTFDLIVSNNGLNNVQNIKYALQECRRIAKKGCSLIITQNLPGTFKEFYDVFKNLLTRMDRKDLVKKTDEHIAEKRKNVRDMVELISKAGFSVNNIRNNSFSYCFADGTAFLNYFFVRLAFMDSWEKIVDTVDEKKSFFRSLETDLNRKALMEGSLNMPVPYACFECSC